MVPGRYIIWFIKCSFVCSVSSLIDSFCIRHSIITVLDLILVSVNVKIVSRLNFELRFKLKSFDNVFILLIMQIGCI